VNAPELRNWPAAQLRALTLAERALIGSAASGSLHQLVHALGLRPIERVAAALAADTEPLVARAIGWLQAHTRAASLDLDPGRFRWSGRVVNFHFRQRTP
jgi:hypothetical protein